MADEILRSKHAFGQLSNLENAIEQKAVDSYDILFMTDDNGKAVIGWLDKNGKPVIVTDEKADLTELEKDVSELETVVSTKANVADVNAVNVKVDTLDSEVDTLDSNVKTLESKVDTKANADEVNAEINALVSEVATKVGSEEVANAVVEAKAYAETEVDEALVEVNASYEKVKYEITNTPVGALVDYRDKEIRVMCPANTTWVKQSVGSNGNANMYYMSFKAYAPDNAVGFKEGDRGVIIDEYFDFNSEFAGTDKFGRNYSVCWLALASYNEANGTWTYFGKNSSTEKYIGWDYIVEWYNADGVVIASDKIRINLSNEDCHYAIEPSYVSNAINTAKSYTDEQIAKVNSAYQIVEF